MAERQNRTGVHAITSVNPKEAKDRWCVSLRNTILVDKLELASPQTHKREREEREEKKVQKANSNERCLGYKYVRSIQIEFFKSCGIIRCVYKITQP